ncbi:1-aminocyclopropane-1-carboxylate deaminase/D-cysteine desulfhydrase [Hymenobacter busanensis]|uniref:1-aminocyclopropane-1-carboxylate deaminase/D-cysteine desulfhydrase n=1 Tax=Hymenobacter busanensis TaxID=2607656 RepID=A0A7L5A310_9BACT|nr:1-aminocyclopropane-1-carboxylate deaminase/D-cysteine desulfhydrase [Hymenobacter busanensis]QHJ09727.1 pyridoxal-phosphate dependent enzyme [Hymenobacter busanensis]
MTDLPEPVAERRGVRLRVLRDDLHHPELPGNKWRKLKYNLLAAREQGHAALLTFGGAYSNHLAAVATAGRLYGFRTIGIVRGDELEPHNPTLTACAAQGMQLHFVSREDYRRRHDAAWLADVLQRLGPAYVLPEGGTNALAVRGCAEIVSELEAAHEPFDALTVACGTGGTLAGLVLGSQGHQQVVGVSALKGSGGSLRAEVERWVQQTAGRTFGNWELRTEFHFGGYARYSVPLLAFIEQFYQRHGVLLDPVYTGKLLYGTLALVEAGHFPRGSTVVAVHTGGLQGWAGFAARFGVRPPAAV